MTAIDRLALALVDTHPIDAARTLERLEPRAAAAFLRELEPASGAVVLARMDATFVAALLEELGAEGATLVAALPATDAAALLRRTSPPITEAVLAACPAPFAAAVSAVIAQPVWSAGALMDPLAPSLPRDLTAADALAKIRDLPERFKHYIYIVDREGVLVGVVRLLDLVAAKPEAVVDDLMRTPVARLHADEPEVAALAHPGWASYTSLPVVDGKQRLVGVIRDDVVRSVRERLGAARRGAPVSLALSLAELFWLGLAGVTEGVASVVGREAAKPAAPAAGDVAPEKLA